MNGPDHYREAESLLNRAQLDDHQYDTRDEDRANVTAAQVHATLALAAATQLRLAHEFYEVADDVEEWAEVTGAAVLRDHVGPRDNQTGDARAPELTEKALAEIPWGDLFDACRAYLDAYRTDTEDGTAVKAAIGALRRALRHESRE